MASMSQIIEYAESKRNAYRQYDFTQEQADALKTFYDLAQEFNEIEELYFLCVAVPKVFLNLDAMLYLYDSRTLELSLVAKTENPEKGLYKPPPDDISPADSTYRSGNNLIVTIKGKGILSEQLPNTHKNNILGTLVVYPNTNLTEADEFFLEKYANRIGFNIHNRLLLNKNIEHLKFIRNLVADIEHNIIVPNMIFKLFLRRMKGKITKNLEIEKFLNKYTHDVECDEVCIEHLLAELSEVNQGLIEEFQNIDKHYQNTSLFLETLFRKSHFDKGHLTLRTKPCNMHKDIILHQIDRFIDRFKEMGIMVEDCCAKEADEIITVVDLGLIAQVFANLFSNALKYTDYATDDSGKKYKLMRYCREIMPGYFGADKDGVKYSVFTTGENIKTEERDKIFDEGFRGSNIGSRPGTGHGLTFIKNAVEIHGGVFGYDPLPRGNSFYFVLPV
ncbi:GAF domain-containing sensor histidine kinase [Candidatus Magnetomonas plexicatena]|uniref:GAF domain-containing sensor histidine kinase n=1 Tax=Candidatus Magnetomonas plexicatena TaxID=2552947 RepID=UPI001C78A1F2|nr:sensor histidine kinase [Nitrospirales bacterium LBB_01]